jgi:hypothetical protein
MPEDTYGRNSGKLQKKILDVVSLWKEVPKPRLNFV